MACSPERYSNLPIAPQYKQRLLEFCNDPKNDAACTQLCESSDEEIVQSIQQIEGQLKEWQENGIPDEVKNAHPDLAAEIDSPLNEAKTAEAPATEQGIGALQPPPTQTNPNIPPGQLADVPMPMDVPSSPSNASVASYGNGGFVNAPKFSLGGSLKKALGGSSGILGGIIGGAAAFFTGGMSLVAGAALGSAAGTYADTGDFGAAAGAGLGVYTLGSAGAGIMSGTAGGVAKGVAKGASMLGGSQPNPMQSGFSAPMPMQASGPQESATIPGSGSSPVTSNPQLREGLGELPSLSPMAAQPVAETDTASLDLDPMSAYYQCVIANGADNCQMPQEDSMPTQGRPVQYGPSQQQPVNLQPAEYAQNYQGGGAVDGLGTETSDSQPAWLSDNEFVFTADAVRGAGNGDVDIGATKMYDLMAELEQRGH